ncbi:hypothetical protein DAETH_28630 [Deinococcus aetherius]|uniref:Uncharacterized protein n=1 Tax=Deinococcus aetherius TaxID=200252 RepID=A0ABM8AGV0_9DEIO|nr:hypothetical protein [Deinococcus aetherius]BDP42894.1 hypothetical protein DAETH_28630 [Deinococcus aetherius]
MPDLAPTVTAPSFQDHPLAYYRWHLAHHAEMFVEFRRLADWYRVTKSDRRVSADMICHVMRFQAGLKATDDQFAVNNVLTPLYARLYKRQRPGANVETRTSQLDDLSEETWVELLALVPDEVTP